MGRGESNILYGENVFAGATRKKWTFFSDLKEGVFRGAPRSLLFQKGGGWYHSAGKIHSLAGEKSKSILGAPLASYNSGVITIHDQRGFLLLPDGEILETSPIPKERVSHARFSARTLYLIMADGTLLMSAREGKDFSAWRKKHGFHVRKVTPGYQGLILEADDEDEGRQAYLYHDGTGGVYISDDFPGDIFNFVVSDRGEVVFLDQNDLITRYNFTDKRRNADLFSLEESLASPALDMVTDGKALYVLSEEEITAFEWSGKKIDSQKLSFQPHSLRIDQNQILAFGDNRYQILGLGGK